MVVARRTALVSGLAPCMNSSLVWNGLYGRLSSGNRRAGEGGTKFEDDPPAWSPVRSGSCTKPPPPFPSPPSPSFCFGRPGLTTSEVLDFFFAPVAPFFLFFYFNSQVSSFSYLCRRERIPTLRVAGPFPNMRSVPVPQFIFDKFKLFVSSITRGASCET